MTRKPLTRLQAGDRLAEDVLDARGGLVLAAGSELNDHLLLRLARLGLEELAVEDTKPALDEAVVREAVARRFARWRGDDLMGRLQDVVLRYRLRAGA